MAERRMFAKTIVLSDAFLDMPLSARCLYFTFGMLADDDGFVNSPKSIMRQSGASNDDLNLLIAKKFILTFDSGVIVIKHWRINNYLRNDRYKETTYLEEKNALVIKENGVYDAGIPNGIPAVYPSGIPSIGKDRLDKVSIGKDSIYISAQNSEAAEPPSDTAPKEDNTNVIAFLPLVTGEEYGITAEDFDTWQSAYPAVDVLGDLKKMRAWLDANPTRRKTARGIKRFIVGWLERSQNSAPRQGTSTGEQSNNVFMQIYEERYGGKS
ncbi:MAG: hypothetical protein KH382_08105 [Clostridiales bacterium]|nr:hypothetical protein [Clostridiales bacterium]DAH17306.1 MAG TPA: replisome organizer [Caudoviricetes sp.]